MNFVRSLATSKNIIFPLLKVGFFIAVGAFLAAFAIDIFFLHNNLIDGGTVGLAMIAGRLIGPSWIPLFILLFTLPFVYFAFRFIGKKFVMFMVFALALFSLFLTLIPIFIPTPFVGDPLEVVAIGGAILGAGLGLIIRSGGCLDGTEILGVICNRKLGFTVGQVVFCCNIFVYSVAGIVFRDWHPALLSLIAYVVVVKIMDVVLVGLDETKAVLVVSRKFREIQEVVMHDLGLGVTILNGRGGFSKDPLEVLYIISERLQLSILKDRIHAIDPNAFIAITNLHEVASGRDRKGLKRYKPKKGSSLHELFVKYKGVSS